MKIIDDKKNTIWNAIGITLNSFNSFFFLLIIKLINGMDIAGMFTYGFSLCCLFFYISIFYNRTYQVSDYKNEYSFNQYFTLRIITIIFSLILITVFSLINPFSSLKVAIIILIMIFRSIEALSECFYGDLQKNDKLYCTGISLTIKSLGGIIIFGVVDYFSKSIIYSLLSLIAVWIIVFIFYDYRLFKKCNDNRLELNTKNINKIIISTLSLCIFTVLSLYLINCQKFLITYTLSNDLQTIFGIILLPGTFTSLLGNYIIMPYVGKITEFYKNNDYKSIYKTVIKICSVLMCLGIIILIGCNFMGIPFLNIAFNIDLNNYKNEFLILFFGSIFVALCMIISNTLTIMRDNNRQLLVYGCSAILSTVITILLVNKHLLLGAALSYSISYIVCFILYLLLFIYNLIKMKRR